MPDFDHREKKLEEAIEHFLLTEGGYVKGSGMSFSKELGLETQTLLTFVQNTQPKEWEKYQAIYGKNCNKAFLDRFSKEVRQVGLIRALRQGIKDRCINFRLAYFKPETALNEQTVKMYEQNRLSCTRQLHYTNRNNNSLDMVLFLNGIPIITLELKDQFTGQDVNDAIKQYKYDRSPTEPIFDFPNRTLVHFAVDLKGVYMTTKLDSGNTTFLPFNQGSGGAGSVGKAGNPTREDNFAVAYLWENVLYKDRLMEILQKFVHLDKKTKEDKAGKKTERKSIIFPRYHQLDVVRKLLIDVKENGSGKNYLIQHSAGSGKSNSIDWLAHRLSGLHNDRNEKIFKSVIVVTDRKVLDNQLQDMIFQFDHRLGVAFSGKVNDDGEEYTEEKLNKNAKGKSIKEKQLPEYFESDEFNMLIVAEKYQTGFDEPLLHTMFVDKKLSGVKAVQTLSRLNRMTPGKEDTFVLDFVNTAEEIKVSFEPYYQATILTEEASPNIIYDIKNKLDEYRLWQQSEIEQFTKIYYKSTDQEIPDLGKLSASLQPALDRLADKDEKEQEEIKTALARFNRLYAFITQVCRMFDIEMQKFSVYAKFLMKMIPKGKLEKIKVDDKVLLEKYKLEKNFEGFILLEGGSELGPAKGHIGGKDKKKETLSAIIEKINLRFGTDFSEMDQVLAQLTRDFMADERLVDLARNNPQSTFEKIFEQEFMDVAALRYEQNEEFFVRMFKDEEFMSEVIRMMLPEIYRRLRKKKD